MQDPPDHTTARSATRGKIARSGKSLSGAAASDSTVHDDDDPSLPPPAMSSVAGTPNGHPARSPATFSPTSSRPPAAAAAGLDAAASTSTSTDSVPVASTSTAPLPVASSSSAAARPPPKRRAKKFSRSRTGCLACRVVKQRCDEQKPVCVRCQVAGKECTWPLTVTQAAASTAVSPAGQPQPPLPTLAQTYHLDALHAPASRSSSSSPSLWPQVPAPGLSASSYGVAPLLASAPPAPLLTLSVGPPPQTASDQLELCFPPEERDLMRHLLGNGASLSQGIPSHLPILFLHPAQLTASPRGLSIPTDALLFSLLAMASTHQSSVLSRRPPTLDVTRAREAQDRARVLAAHLSTAAHALLLSAMAMSSTASDLLISTALLLVFGSILGATRDWRANLDVARRLLELRGGPATVLAETRAAMGRGELDGSALMRLRAMLEYLAMLDVVACLGTGSTPTMIEPFSSWWFDFVSVGQGAPGQATILDPSSAPSDWETVETALGVSRGLVELLNRTVVLVGQCLDPQATVGCHPPPPASFEDRLARAQDLLLELEIWKGDVDPADPGQGLTRLEFGNIIFAHAIKILVLTDVLNVPHADASVQEAARVGQQLLLRNSIDTGQVVLLMWPALIFGCLQLSHDALGRSTTRAVLESMRDTCAWDVDAAFDLVHHVWACRDRGEPDPSWRDYQRSGGLLFV